MPIDPSSLALAWLAGVVGILSPCVWPLVPVVMASAADTGRTGPLFLGLGLSVSFAVAGTFLTFALIALGLDPDAFRPIAALLLVLVGLLLLIKPLGDAVSLRLSQLSGRLNIGTGQADGRYGQFGIGALLGLVWLPCVGPTLGAAIALASVGQDFGQAFAVMAAFGLGTSMALLVTGSLSTRALQAIRPGLMVQAARLKSVLGLLLLILGLMVLTGIDKQLEILALNYLPEWVSGF
jgi:cytochrome c-type biogenesis protein